MANLKSITKNLPRGRDIWDMVMQIIQGPPKPLLSPKASPGFTGLTPTNTPTPTSTPAPRPTPTPIPETEDWHNQQLIKQILSYFPQEEGYNPVNIAFRESSLDPKEEGNLGERGLFQILPSTFHGEKAQRKDFPDYTWDQMFEPGPNIEVAKWLYENRGGWQPWSTREGLGL